MSHLQVSSPTARDRRRHPRKAGDDGDLGYFMVAGRPAKLVDWSFGGIGVQIAGQIRFRVADTVELRIFDPERDTWESLNGLIRRVEHDGTLGITFADDGENTVRVLLHLLSNRLARTLS
ncbi:MAG: PilZ domain-containing protein [Rhodospirillaceae bacterium]